MDASTVLWWLKQSKDAQSVFIGNDKEESINAVLSKFNEFISVSCDKPPVVWGCGPSFDQTIMRAAYERCGINAPWGFWSERCVRTIDDIAKQIKHVSRKDMQFDGVKHDALDDAIHQAKFVSSVMMNINK